MIPQSLRVPANLTAARPSAKQRVCAAVAAAVVLWSGRAAAADESILDMSIEELAGLRITSVSRQEESLADAAAAVFVITAADIRRSGVTSIAEALRLAPGVEVARRNSHSWSIAIRGFNSDITNKLLVLIDGRSVYSPLYAGVFWDVQDTLLEDVERIEVISGPGGTLWGANAVNGVINVITRSAATGAAGAFMEFGAGNEDRRFAAFRYGGTLGDRIGARAYIKYLDRDSTTRLTGAAGVDDARLAQGGFRLDWETTASDRWTLQGDVYSGDEGGEFLDAFTLGTLPAGSTVADADVSGANVLGRWERRLHETADLSLQIYYDYTRRDIPNTYDETRGTADVDFQHHVRLGERNDVLWGAGFRWTADELENTLFSTFDPDQRSDRTFSAFVQDKIELRAERLFLTLGSKFEDNDYSGFESQPNARLTWLVDERQTFWAAMSRAVRIPSRLDADLRLTLPLAVAAFPVPVYVTANGNRDFAAEELLAREAGYRIQTTDNLSFDLAAFHTRYDNLQTVEPQAPVLVLVPPLPYIVVPNILDNNMEGESSGITLTVNWQPVSPWRVRFQYAYLDLSLNTKPGSLDVERPKLVGNDPKHQLGIHSFLDLPHNLSLYTGMRYVDELRNQQVPRYTAVDATLTWEARSGLRVSLAVQNLNDDRHLEFGSGANLIERSTSIRAAWVF